MDDAFLKWVIGCAAVFGIVGVAIALGMGHNDWALGIGVGAGISLGNLWALKRMIHRLIATKKAGSTAGLFFMKLVILGGLLWVCMKLLPMNPIAFAVGLSVVVFAVPLGTLFGPVPSTEDENDGTAAEME